MKFGSLIGYCHKIFHKEFEVSSPKNVGVVMQKLVSSVYILCALVTPLIKPKNAPYFRITFLNDLPK